MDAHDVIPVSCQGNAYCILRIRPLHPRLAPVAGHYRLKNGMHMPVSRRSFTAGIGLLALGATSEALPGVAGSPPARAPDLALPENNLRALVRMTASLKERDVPWWYDGTIFGVVPGRASATAGQIPGHGTLLDASPAGWCL